MKLLNLGCGSRFHEDWINVDYTNTGEGVIALDLSKGIPFADSSFDVVYNSHLLEHFPKDVANSFMQECYRVLKPGGIIRIVVPDLELIAMEYLSNLNRALAKEPNAEFDYEWIMLELFDQTVRNCSGGYMAAYLKRKEIPNKEYVFNRVGNEAKAIHENYIDSMRNVKTEQSLSFLAKRKMQVKRLFTIFFSTKDKNTELKIGKFRLSGEIHQWMYDRYSLGKLLAGCRFTDINVVTAFESKISDWHKYQLDTIDNMIRKPDSLFMEATK